MKLTLDLFPKDTVVRQTTVLGFKVLGSYINLNIIQKAVESVTKPATVKKEAMFMAIPRTQNLGIGNARFAK